MSWQRPLPTRSPETKPFWDAADAGRFIVQQCRACQEFQFPYRGFCCHCWSSELDEREATTGTVFTHSTIYRNDTTGFAADVPYVAAMVRLDDDRGGLMVQTNIVGCDPDSVHIGLPVQVVFQATVHDQQIPMFTPGDLMSETSVRTVKVGIGGPMGPPASMLASRPQAAERAGYASMWWGDHYMGWVPRSIWTPDISAAARPGSNPDTFFDPVAAMAVAGAATSEISIGITTESIRRHPVALAQQFLTLQHITGGRAILGLGGGEGENILPYGLPFDRPVGRLEESIRIIRTLWGSEGPVRFEGEHFRFDDAVFGLAAPEAGFPEVWLCGAGPRMCRIAGELGDGWLPAMVTPEDYADRVGRIHKARAGAGREQDPFTFGLLVFTVITESIGAAEPLLRHPFVKGMCLTLPASAYERFGVPHPLGESAVGVTEYVPGRFGRDEALAMIDAIPEEVVRTYVPHGSPDDVQRQLEPYVQSGLEHVVLLNVTPLADPALARESFALTDGMARGLTFQL